MGLSRSQAMILGALAQGEPMTTRQLSAHTGLATTTARSAAAFLAYDGWANGTDRIPTYWRITDCGRRLAATRAYREFQAIKA